MSDPAGPGTKRIYLCRRPDNALFWVPDHCRGHGWTIERTETVPARVPWEQQLEIARAKRNAGEQLRQAAMVPPSVVQQYPDSGDAKASRCSYLDERIKDLDRMGRAGSRLYDLDWIRRERKSTRDEQFRLRC
ncbi:hypothetical protein [Alicycliphilus denitrificans]|uniref:hypothetical protein n=1 Tax=Alicycliphilus denitrificans TaxID=179636 RepID=UPI00384E3527